MSLASCNRGESVVLPSDALLEGEQEYAQVLDDRNQQCLRSVQLVCSNCGSLAAKTARWTAKRHTLSVKAPVCHYITSLNYIVECIE